MLENTILKNEQVEGFIKENLFSEAAELLFTTQFNEWELMRENYNSLNEVREKSFWFDGYKLKVKFNPRRIKSTSADVRDEAIKSRKCFLCVENLPPEQKGILIIDNYLLLCNPYPIFSQHFTVSLLKHEPQRIYKNIIDFLEITRLLSDKYSLIYNGPECGASAPDHLHYQALTKNFMPIENDIHQIKNDFGNIIFDEEQKTVTSIDDGLRRFLFLEAPDIRPTVKLFERFYKSYSEHTKSSSEPLLNLLSGYNEEFGFRLIIFLRSKHRPRSFFDEEPRKLIVSPAAVDLGGLLVSPREEDFNRLDKDLIHTLINEVSLERGSFVNFTELLKSELN